MKKMKKMLALIASLSIASTMLGTVPVMAETNDVTVLHSEDFSGTELKGKVPSVTPWWLSEEELKEMQDAGMSTKTPNPNVHIGGGALKMIDGDYDGDGTADAKTTSNTSSSRMLKSSLFRYHSLSQ